MINNVMNLGDFLTSAAQRYADEPGLICGENVYNWAQINHRVNAVASSLRELGVGKGDRILVHSRNNLALFESAWIAFKLGTIWVPTNYRIAPPEAAYLGASSKASVMIYDQGFTTHVDAVLESSRALRHVIALAAPRRGELDYEELAGRSVEAFVSAEVQRDDPLWFFYTSGTTGKPKAGTLTHGQMAFVVNNHLADLLPGITFRSRSLVVAPLSHGAGIHAIVNTARAAASVLPSGEKLEPEEAWRLVEKYQVDNMFTVPTIVKMLTEHESVDRYDHKSLKYVVYAGAPMYRTDQKHALAKLGKVLVQYYGLGEVTGNITVLPPDLHESEDGAVNSKVGSCGYPRTGIEVAILDEDGRRLPSYESGEICVRGPAVFTGYDDNPAANEKAFKFGWFHTGDLGFLDSEGFLFITGRESDMYISGGSNVYPREIEEVLLTHPAIHEATVVGIPDPKWGEIGIAVLVCKSEKPGEQELYSHIEKKLAKYKWPKRFVFWDDLPKSAYGKVTKKNVREKLLFELNTQEEDRRVL